MSVTCNPVLHLIYIDQALINTAEGKSVHSSIEKSSEKMYLTAKQMLIGWDQVEGHRIFNNGELLK